MAETASGAFPALRAESAAVGGARSTRPGGGADAALIARVAAGDGDALAALFDRHAATLLGLLERILGAGGEAEEVLQEVFLQIWREAGRYRPERAGPRGWMVLLARSRALDRLQSGASRRRREERFQGASGRRVVVPIGSRRLEHQERRRVLRAALATLSPDQRRAVELAFFDGLTHVEIAARLGAPLGTVKSRVLLGMRKLRRLLTSPEDRHLSAPPDGS